MRRLVIDAGTLLTWFDNSGGGRSMRAEYEDGQLMVVAPRTILADTIALLAQRPGWDVRRLERVAVELGRLDIELHDPPVAELARWIGSGLPADHAAYPALAAFLDLRLATTEPRLRKAAAPLVIGS